MQEIYIGRQPIYTRKLELFAYELLHRANESSNEAGTLDQNQATTDVVLNTLLGFGLDQLVGRKKAFINLPRSFVVGELPLPFSKEQVVLEILEDIKADEAVINAVRNFAQQGFEIALDDFIFHEDLRPLVEVSRIIKIDVLSLPRERVREHVAILRDYDVQLLAEKVETHDDYEFARELGFDYFQGYFLCRPKIITGHSIPTNKLAVLRLLAKLQDPETTIKPLADLISQDISLSYKLLRSLNSAYYGLSKPIESIHHAIVYLGLQQIKRWVSLITLSSIPDKPSHLMVVATTRAKMCESLGEILGENKESCFTVGLFSVLDALMDTPMKKALANIPLTPDISQALLKHEGTLGRILDGVLAYEQGQWEKVDNLNIAPKQLTESYINSVSWAEEISQAI